MVGSRCQQSRMSTRGGSNLNRILRLTANLLFEKGESVPAVRDLLDGFVTPAAVRTWYEKYCEVNGLEYSVNSARRYRRMPMPPIDFDAVKIQELENLLESPAGQESRNVVEPEW